MCLLVTTFDNVVMARCFLLSSLMLLFELSFCPLIRGYFFNPSGFSKITLCMTYAAISPNNRSLVTELNTNFLCTGSDWSRNFKEFLWSDGTTHTANDYLILISTSKLWGLLREIYLFSVCIYCHLEVSSKPNWCLVASLSPSTNRLERPGYTCNWPLNIDIL